jgi:hypothetical protein
VPAPLIGEGDNSTYNNLDTLKKDFWQDTITVWLEEFRQDLTRQILIPFYGDGRRTRTPRLRFMYDFSNVEALQSNMREKAEIAKILREVGYDLRTVNQMLEFDVDIPEEAPQAAPQLPQPAPQLPQPPTEPDDTIMRSMALSALDGVDNPEIFVKAIHMIHKSWAAKNGKTPNHEAAEARAKNYLTAYGLKPNQSRDEWASFIAKSEMSA